MCVCVYTLLYLRKLSELWRMEEEGKGEEEEEEDRIRIFSD